MTPAIVLVSVAAVAAVLGAGWSRAGAAEAAAASETGARSPQATVERSGIPFAEKFPNLVLKTHEGENVRFYDDLLKDKVVLINFFYVTCEER